MAKFIKKTNHVSFIYVKFIGDVNNEHEGMLVNVSISFPYGRKNENFYVPAIFMPKLNYYLILLVKGDKTIWMEVI